MFALAAVLVLVFIILADIIGTKEYITGTRVHGWVTDDAGIHETANYGKHQAATKYYKYTVGFNVNGEEHTGTHLSKTKLNIGDSVEVRYIVVKGHIEITNRDRKDRFVRFAVCMVITVALILLVYIYK